ncbi:MAG: hypothetical protein FJW36_22010 [Acidobacteria bacterium]|nr:hypothetical protein [Acidobacteriota bacterium]
MLRSLLFFVVSIVLAAAPPKPEEILGYKPGTDYKLMDYEELSKYFEALAKSSNRIKLIEVGKTSEGRPHLLALLSSEENLRNIDKYKEMNRKLALGLATPAEADTFAKEGKVFVWIDSSMHATEVAPAQHAPDLAYKFITDESDETRRIRDKVILVQVPCTNPDGMTMVSHWYRKNVGTPYEMAPVPFLYQKHAGHDNNRDWFMLNLPETRNLTRQLFHEYFPQIVYNQHQIAPFPARIFLPPYAEPLNPNIPSSVMEGINLIGTAMRERFHRENKPGAVSYMGFDAWWNGGLRTVPAFHNMHGILTEVAGYGYATPKDYKPSELGERFSNGIPTKFPTVFYPLPWQGGRWALRDAMDYMLTADWGIFDIASLRSEQFLKKAWELATQNIKNEAIFGYMVSATQRDPHAAAGLLDRLQQAGIEVHRLNKTVTHNFQTYPEGSYLLKAQQAFRGYLVDLLEPQKYPELRSGQTGPTKRPYDLAGWTLSMQMGVDVERLDAPLPAEVTYSKVDKVQFPEPTSNPSDSASFLKIADTLKKGGSVNWGNLKLKTPRVAVYEPHTANMDAGWTMWLLENFKIPYTAIKNDDIQRGNLKGRFDAIILAQQSAESIVHGNRHGVANQRPEFTGGIGTKGLAALEDFVKDGGSLLAFDTATQLPIQNFSIGVRGLLTPSAERNEDVNPNAFYAPGSLIRINVDTNHPVAQGMAQDAIAMTTGGQAFESIGSADVKVLARYASKDLLASGWLSGERLVLGKPIAVEARLGKGNVLLYGFRPQFRGQPYGTFKLVLNALYLASAERIQ